MAPLAEEIKWQIDRVVSDSQITREELDDLKKSVSCLAPETLSDIRAYIETKTQIREEARAKLQSLFTECIPDTMPNPDKVFYGARSEIFSPANRRDVARIVSESLHLEQYPFVTNERRENILLAVTDRFIHDPDFQDMVSTGINFAQMAHNFVRSMASDDSSESEKAERAKKAGGQAKEQAKTLDERIAAIVARSIDPIKRGFEQANITELTASVLDDPRSLAKYDGGQVLTNIVTIDADSLRQYVQGLNTEVLAIDKKILPLEMIREQGLNFIAQAPESVQGIIVDIIKWILETLPFLGNIIARMTGYRDAEDLGNGLEEELRQRRSLGVLRQFGRVRDVNGKESDGAYKGKIKLLEDRDLSGVNRKKLWDFFTFTKESGVKTDTSEFWMGIFNDGKIVTKDSEGKDDVYEIGKIEEKDLEEDYKGVYEKLNGVLSARNTKRTQLEEQRRSEVAAAETAQREAKRMAEEAKMRADQATAIAREQVRVKPYEELIQSQLDDATVGKLVNIRVANLRDGKYVQLANTALRDSSYDETRGAIMKSLATLAEVVKSMDDGKLAEVAGVNLIFRNLYAKRAELLITSGLTQEIETAEMKKAREWLEKIAKDRENERKIGEYAKMREQAIVRIVTNASTLPVALDWLQNGFTEDHMKEARELWMVMPEWEMSFDLEHSQIVLANRRFNMRPLAMKNAKIKGAKIVSGGLQLDGSVVIPKVSEMSIGSFTVERAKLIDLVRSLIDSKFGDTVRHAFDTKLEIKAV